MEETSTKIVLTVFNLQQLLQKMLKRNYDTRWHTTYFNKIGKNLYLILFLNFVYVRL